jgi:AAA15 family ATPase/GTPase
MLLNFRIANFRSLRDPQELDLHAVYRSEPSPLNVAALYGANASGKSNVLLALEFMHDAVVDVNNWSDRESVRVQPFSLDSNSRTQPTSFAVDLEIDGVRYSYGFSATRKEITEEWLHWFPKKKKRVVFEREKGEYYFGPTYASARASLITEITAPTKLYITTAAKTKMQTAAAVFDWFDKSLLFMDDTEPSQDGQRRLTLEVLRDPDSAAQAQELLRAADLGISQAMADEVEFEYQEVANGPQDSFQVVQVPDGKTTIIYTGERPDLTPELKAQIAADLVTFQHYGERPSRLPLHDESRGTRTWFNVIGPLIRAISSGCTLVIDELDTSLHPILLSRMIQLFQRDDSNRNGAQLIFTTHDASLMGRPGGEELLRRDEIWFTQKRESGATELYPLTDFKPRSGLNWEKRYLGGAVGAVPYVSSASFVEALDGRSSA